MKIKIIFSFLSAAFFTLGVLFVCPRTDIRGEVLGDNAVSTSLTTDGAVSLPETSVNTVSSMVTAPVGLTPPALSRWSLSGSTSIEVELDTTGKRIRSGHIQDHPERNTHQNLHGRAFV
jgi:hypothetical protein